MREIYPTRLSDYLSIQASKKGIDKKELEKNTEIGSLLVTAGSFFRSPAKLADKRLRELYDKYDLDAMVDVTRTPSKSCLGLVNMYEIEATCVKFNKK